MARSEQYHSQLISWLKILLPLLALGLLSTIFLYARGDDPITQIPIFADGFNPEGEEQVSAAFFAGVTDAGHTLRIQARRARAATDSRAGLIADEVAAVVGLAQGGEILIVADQGRVIEGQSQMALQGNVTVESSVGYTIRSERLDARTDSVTLESPGAVDADGPGVTLSAGRMLISETPDTDDVQIEFTGGVKMVYMPQTSKEQ